MKLPLEMSTVFADLQELKLGQWQGRQDQYICQDICCSHGGERELEELRKSGGLDLGGR